MARMHEYQLIDGDQTVYRDGTIKLHTEEGYEGMRAAGRLAATILDEVADLVQPGVTTESIDTRIREMMLDGGAVPATLGYRGYTHSSCISINHVICHGIPGEKVLKDGDILNVDVTPLLDGWHGDTSRMFLVGDKVGVPAAALALGWVAAQPGVTAVIAGCRSPQQVHENICADPVAGSPKVIEALNRVVSRRAAPRW